MCRVAENKQQPRMKINSTSSLKQNPTEPKSTLCLPKIFPGVLFGPGLPKPLEAFYLSVSPMAQNAHVGRCRCLGIKAQYRSDCVLSLKADLFCNSNEHRSDIGTEAPMDFQASADGATMIDFL